MLFSQFARAPSTRTHTHTHTHTRWHWPQRTRGSTRGMHGSEPAAGVSQCARNMHGVRATATACHCRCWHHCHAGTRVHPYWHCTELGPLARCIVTRGTTMPWYKHSTAERTWERTARQVREEKRRDRGGTTATGTGKSACASSLPHYAYFVRDRTQTTSRHRGRQVQCQGTCACGVEGEEKRQRWKREEKFGCQQYQVCTVLLLSQVG